MAVFYSTEVSSKYTIEVGYPRLEHWLLDLALPLRHPSVNGVLQGRDVEVRSHLPSRRVVAMSSSQVGIVSVYVNIYI